MGTRKYARGRAYDPDRFTKGRQVAEQADAEETAEEIPTEQPVKEIAAETEAAAAAAETENQDTVGEDTEEFCEESFEDDASEDE